MKQLSRYLVVIVAVLSVALSIVVFWAHHKRKRQAAQAEVTAQAPQIADKLSRQVKVLEGESSRESVAKLSDVNMFYWPGPRPNSGGFVAQYIPLGKDAGSADLEAIMSNRRFRKVLSELHQLEKSAASSLINRELVSAIPEYLELYEAEMRRLAPNYKLDKVGEQRFIAGPAFSIENVPEGKVVIVGAKLKILSLVWICGMLELTGTKENVDKVARLALKQRTELYGDSSLHPFFKAQMLKQVSLYNRQIISSGLLGASESPDLGARDTKAGQLDWQSRELVGYKAASTEFDLPVFSGVMKPDSSQGVLSIKWVSVMEDTDFDRLLKELRIAE
jgi:hypothetical protein